MEHLVIGVKGHFFLCGLCLQEADKKQPSFLSMRGTQTAVMGNSLLDDTFSVYGVITDCRVTRSSVYFTLVNYDKGKMWQRHCVIPYHQYVIHMKDKNATAPVHSLSMLRSIDDGWYALVTFDVVEKHKDFLLPKKQRKATYHVRRCVVGSSTNDVLDDSLSVF
jgi:hypothetical protein